MNSQAKDVTEMIFGLIEGAKHFLPDRFLNTDIAEKIWSRVLPTKHKPKDYALAIAREIMECNSKDAKKVDPAMALIYTLGCEEMRDVFYPRFHRSKGICQDLLLEQHLEHWLNMLPNEWRKANNNFPDNLAKSIPSLYRNSTGFLFNIAEESYYKGISYDLRDVADLCINMLLIRISSDEFTVKFLDHYPWVKERQSRLYECAQQKTVEFDELDPLKRMEMHMEKGIEIWQSTFKSIDSFIDGRERIRTKDALFTTELINNFIHDAQYSPAKMVQYNFAREVEAMRHCAEGILEASAEDEAIFEIAESFKLDLIAKEDPPSLPDFVLSSDNYKTLTAFDEDMRNSTPFSGADYQRFFDLMNDRDELSETISSIVQGSDMSELAKLGEYGHQLKALIEEIMTAGRDVFGGLSESYRRYRELTTKIIPLNAEEIPVENNSMEDAARITEQIQAQNEELGQLRVNLNKSELALQVSREREAEMTELNNHLSQEIDQLKRALHAARSIPVVEKGGDDFNTELSGEWLRGVLREDTRSTPEQILIAYATIAPDRVVVLPNAMKSAREADNFELPARLAQVMDSLVYQYLDLIRKGVPDTQAKEVLGNRYAANESQTVTNNSRLRAQRECSYNGETLFFRQHIGIGSGYGTQHAIRIHFKVINSKIVIAYCGAHLETMRTN